MYNCNAESKDMNVVFAGLFIDKAASLIRFPPRYLELWKGNPHLEAVGP